jgi:hypothetical protein
MEFLTKQATEITALEVVTRSGDRISASFNANGAEPTSGKDDAFKSLDAMKAFLSEDSTGPSVELSASAAKSKGPGSDFLTSKDWSLEYAKSHVDVTYDKCFTDGKAKTNRAPPAPEASSLPPKKRTGKTDWNAMYSSALSPLVEAAARAQPQPVQQAAVDALSRSPTKPHGGGDKKRKPRKIIPDEMEYVDDFSDQGTWLLSRFIQKLLGLFRVSMYPCHAFFKMERCSIWQRWKVRFKSNHSTTLGNRHASYPGYYLLGCTAGPITILETNYIVSLSSKNKPFIETVPRLKRQTSLRPSWTRCIMAKRVDS